MTNSINEDDIRRLYQDDGLSIRDAADKLGVSPATLNRYMKKYGISSRDKSTAQKKYIKENGHQMLGIPKSDATKTKISQSLGKFWESLSDKQKEKLKKKMGMAWRRKWAAMSEQERKRTMEELAAKAKEAQGKGSRFERFVAEELKRRGYMVEERSTNYTAGKNFEVDIALPKEKIAIEIDGPSHYTNIYGADALERQTILDDRKNEMILSIGYSVLRIRDNNGALSQLRMNKILDAINKIKQSPKCDVWIYEDD